MKSPHNQQPDHLARQATEDFIAEYARSQKAAKAARKAAELVAEKGSSVHALRQRGAPEPVRDSGASGPRVWGVT